VTLKVPILARLDQCDSQPLL